MTVKHPTASVYLFARFPDGWRVGLIEHPRLRHTTLPGGHVEGDETPAEAAVREAEEETGLVVRLVGSPTVPLPPAYAQRQVPHPWWVLELVVRSDNQLGEPHVHVDHQYLAVAEDPVPHRPGEHPFGWYRADQLDALPMFDGTRDTAWMLFDRLDELVTQASTVPNAASGT